MTIEHVSDLTWDRLHAGELASALAERAREHAAICRSCEARRTALEDAHRRFAASAPRLRMARSARPAMVWRVIGPVFAAAAVLTVLVWFGGDERGGTRTKGGFVVTAFAGRDGDAVPLGAGDPVFPGERLQLSYSAASAGHLAVIAIDGAERVGVYFPADGSTTWPAAAGHRIALPASTELDHVLGNERLWIVFCDRSMALAPLVAQLAAHGIAAQPPAGCEVQRLQFAKRSRSAQGGR
jgi:hypothetical protein